MKSFCSSRYVVWGHIAHITHLNSSHYVLRHFAVRSWQQKTKLTLMKGMPSHSAMWFKSHCQQLVCWTGAVNMQKQALLRQLRRPLCARPAAARRCHFGLLYCSMRHTGRMTACQVQVFLPCFDTQYFPKARDVLQALEN